MNDVDALVLGLAEEVIRRKKAEVALQNALNENQSLAARVAELEKGAKAVKETDG